MPIMIDMEMPKRCEINDLGTGEFAECPLLYDANDCKLFADTRCREWLEGWAIESDNCPLKEIVLCRDCKHRPLPGSEAPLLDDAEASFEGERDYRCPCLCYDSYYSWTPKDDFFCGYGERREE
jgi:hypothetical protein